MSAHQLDLPMTSLDEIGAEAERLRVAALDEPPSSRHPNGRLVVPDSLEARWGAYLDARHEGRPYAHLKPPPLPRGHLGRSRKVGQRRRPAMLRSPAPASLVICAFVADLPLALACAAR